jgi:hypothetical protein
MEKFEQVKASRAKIFVNNFVGGIGWALGATIGFALIVALLSIMLKNVNFIPFVGNFVADIIKFVVQKNPNLLFK